MRARPEWLLLLALSAAACGGKDSKAEDPAAASKKGAEQAAEVVKEPVALIAGYRPFLAPVDTTKPYVPKRQPVHERAAAAAANEIRHAANSARQKIRTDWGPVAGDVQKALVDVLSACADATEDAQFAKCDKSVGALDETLGKAQLTSGVTFPRLATATPSEASKKAIEKLARAAGPLAAEKTFLAKRADASASAADVVNACQNAAAEIDQIQPDYEKADEPIRIVAVTHKMNIDAQCHTIGETDDLQKEVVACKKTPKKHECVETCGKAQARIDEGVPAAAFASLAKDVEASCKKRK
ncbi:MAG TPA: hypothetical protein VHB21_05820 [Minicystis sp.]|nr:hypothetical protein [Minicystis sp.]